MAKPVQRFRIVFRVTSGPDTRVCVPNIVVVKNSDRDVSAKLSAIRIRDAPVGGIMRLPAGPPAMVVVAVTNRDVCSRLSPHKRHHDVLFHFPPFTVPRTARARTRFTSVTRFENVKNRLRRQRYRWRNTVQTKRDRQILRYEFARVEKKHQDTPSVKRRAGPVSFP